MKSHLHTGRGRWQHATLALTLALPLVPFASAQSTDADDEPVKLTSLTVTGSNLPTAGETPVAPVTIIGPVEIARSGVMNDLLQVIRKTAPQFSGNANLGTENGNISSGATNGGSALALRNLATLVLVNGRRMAAAPVGATGGGVFVDVNAIPVSAIARIEILTDGASAIYGTDAVSGVVNIILKSDYRGGEIGGRYGWTTNNGRYQEKSAWGVVGAQLGKNGPNVTLSYEWTKTDPLYNYQRPFATPSYGTTNFPGLIQLGSYDASGAFVGNNNGYYFLDPSLSAPKPGATLAERGYSGPFGAGPANRLFDLSKGVTMLIANEKKVLTAALDQTISPTLSLFGDLIFSRTNTVSQLNAQGFAVRLPANDPKNVIGMDVSVRNRFLTNPRLYKSDTDSLRGVFGLKGKLGDQWSWESAIDYSEGTQDFANANLIRTNARIAAVAAGTIALFARTQPAGATDSLFGEAIGKFNSKLTSWDFKFVGTDVLHAPGGGVNMAIGVEARQESLKATSDVDSQSATFAYDQGTTIDPFDQKRHISSIFAEVNIPIVGKENRLPGVYSADLTLAERHERYSDTSNPTVPKISLRYQPVDETLLFRGTFSKSFAAPTLYQLNAPTSSGSTASLAEFDSSQAFQQSVAVTELKPSRSTNVSAGVVWTPKTIENLSVSLDYFRIKQTDVVSNLGAAGVVDQVFHDIEVNGSASRFASLLHVSSFTGPTITAPGQISSIGLDNLYYSIPAASNIGTQKLSGLDFRINYSVDAGPGKVSWDSTTTYYFNYDVQVVPGTPYNPTAGLVTGLNGTIPRWRTYNVFIYQINQLTAEVAHTYFAATTDTTEVEGYDPNIPAYSVFDASLTYNFKKRARWLRGVQVTVGVNNISNRLPSRSPTFDSLSNADIAEFSPIGRLYYVSAKYRF
ncbi:MAG: TonB-dependent receptor plug domain-containing protein [Opitutus sp.]